MKHALVLALAGAASMAAAQDDPMEVQRCIWRCLADARGADDPAYSSCVASKCDSATPARPAAKQKPAPKSQSAQPTPRASTAPKNPWVYGDQPQLGRGAFGYTTQGVAGLACGTTGWPLDFRVTNGFFHGPSLTVMFDASPIAFSMAAAPGPASQTSGDACTVGLDAFRKASTLYLVNGAIASVTTNGFETVTTLQSNGQTIAVRSADEAFRLLGGAEVALTGSAAAIEQLLAACPAARTSDLEGCND